MAAINKVTEQKMNGARSRSEIFSTEAARSEWRFSLFSSVCIFLLISMGGLERWGEGMSISAPLLRLFAAHPRLPGVCLHVLVHSQDRGEVGEGSGGGRAMRVFVG